MAALDRQPVLIGERLVLRPLEEADRAALYAVAADPLVWQQHPIGDRWQREVFDAFFDESLAAGGGLIASLRDGGAVAGSSQFRPTAFDTEAVEIGWTFLARAHWGTGLNHEMKRLMLEHALESVPRVLFRIGEHNTRSRKAIEAVGGALTNLVEDGHYRGQAVRHVVYMIDRAGFAAGPLAHR
jgi:RimJ/RimL family protein N-acetyltransferase